MEKLLGRNSYPEFIGEHTEKAVDKCPEHRIARSEFEKEYKELKAAFTGNNELTAILGDLYDHAWEVISLSREACYKQGFYDGLKLMSRAINN